MNASFLCRPVACRPCIPLINELMIYQQGQAECHEVSVTQSQGEDMDTQPGHAAVTDDPKNEPLTPIINAVAEIKPEVIPPYINTSKGPRTPPHEPETAELTESSDSLPVAEEILESQTQTSEVMPLEQIQGPRTPGQEPQSVEQAVDPPTEPSAENTVDIKQVCISLF